MFGTVTPSILQLIEEYSITTPFGVNGGTVETDIAVIEFSFNVGNLILFNDTGWQPDNEYGKWRMPSRFILEVLGQDTSMFHQPPQLEYTCLDCGQCVPVTMCKRVMGKYCICYEC